MTTEPILRSGSAGDAVRDLQRRLAALGHGASADAPGSYGPATEAAVTAFQLERGLRSDGVCGPQTWASLTEAGFVLGARLLYLHQPMLRGDDVSELQRELGGLGFDAGRVDGIFGPNTAAAVVQFQRNAGLTTDGICGPDTLAELRRFARGDAGTTVAHVREAENLRERAGAAGRRFAVGETGGLTGLADGLGRALGARDAVVAVLDGDDESAQAAQANGFEAEAFVGLVEGADRCKVAYYGTPGYESPGGRRLAVLVVEELSAAGLGPVPPPVGMRVPLLRETRMPAVLCELGDGCRGRDAELIDAVARACARWAGEPGETP